MTDTPPPSLRDRIDSAIRPAMLIGLQDAELYDEPGRERIGEWADSITEWVLAVVQPEIDAARAAGIRETAQEPIVVRWDRTVIHPATTSDDTTVCCLTDDGRPVALLLDDEYREALGLQLIDPDGDQ